MDYDIIMLGELFTIAIRKYRKIAYFEQYESLCKYWTIRLGYEREEYGMPKYINKYYI